MPALIDATVISNFAAIGRLDLLRTHLQTAYLADAVYREISRGAALGYEFLNNIDEEIADFADGGWLHLVSPELEVERREFEFLARELGAGEAMTLAIAGGRGWSVMTDDREARAVAEARGIELSGTVGALLDLIRAGILTLEEGNALLSEMIEMARYRAPIRDLRSALNP